MKKRIFAFTLIFMVVLYAVSVIPIIYLASETYLGYERYSEGTVISDVRTNCEEAAEKTESGEMTVQQAAEYIVNAKDYSEVYGESAKDVVAVAVIVFDEKGQELCRSENRAGKNKSAFKELDELVDGLLQEPLYDRSVNGIIVDEISLEGERYFCVIGCVEKGVALAFNDSNFCRGFIGVTVVYALMGALLYFRSVSLYNKKDKDKLLKETNGAVL